MVVAFVSLQLEYSHKVQSSWQELLPRLEEIGSAGAPPQRPPEID